MGREIHIWVNLHSAKNLGVPRATEGEGEEGEGKENEGEGRIKRE
jgi:hypothetical protein